MTGVDVFAPLRTVPDGMHAFLPWRDLTAVVGLLELGFGHDLDSRDRRWLSEMAASTSGPWGMLSRVFAVTDRGFKGYVWYADGRLVGNASLMHADADLWVIANVTTHPDYRRLGIARRLMGAALDAAHAAGARQVQLQVRNDNAAAQALYLDMGFWRMSTAATLRLTQVPTAPPSAPHAAGITLTALGRSDRHVARRLLGRAGDLDRGGPTALTVQAIERAGWLDVLDDWLEGKSRRAWCARADGDMRGLLALQTVRERGPHRIDVAVEPRWSGRVEPVLIDAALRALAPSHRGLEVEAEVETRRTAAIAAFRDAGFRLVRVLDRLALDLD